MHVFQDTQKLEKKNHNQMELSPTQSKSLQTITINSAKESNNRLSVGQQLSAKVIATNTETKEVILRLDNTTIKAKTRLPLKPGQSLHLTVIQSGKETILRIQQESIEKAVTQQTLRESLPKQQTLDETLTNLQSIAKQGKNAGIPEKILQFTQRFIQQIPNPAQLSQAQGLKEAILRSGLFLENTLASFVSKNAPPEFNLDFKSFLLQLKSLLLNERNNRKAVVQETPREANRQPQLTTETKILEIAKQLKNAEDSKQIANKEHILDSSQQVKTALQQVLAKINQQQRNISNNLARLLNSTTTSVILPGQKPVQPNLLNPGSINKNSPPPLLKDALAFTTRAQKNNKPEINFLRPGKLSDLIDTLIKQVEAGISRTQLHQLNSLLDADNGKLNWSMEIPVKIDDKLYSIHLHLEKEQTSNEESDPVLTVNIALDLEHLGPVYARITLITENVGVVFWAEREKTYQLSKTHVENLQTNLSKSGLTPENIRFHHGHPPQKSVLNKPQNSALLDIKA